MKGELTRYEGHTEGPWSVQECGHDTTYQADAYINGPEGCIAGVWGTRKKSGQGPNARLIADAPLLLAEVRRLRVELDELRDGVEAAGLEYREDDGPASYWRNTPALDAEHELRALRQSHARLLAALLLVGRVERRGGVPYYNTSGGSLIHQDQMRELGAAVAEAEAL